MSKYDGWPTTAALSIGVKPVSDEHANDVRDIGGADEEGGSQMTLSLPRGSHVMRAAEASEEKNQDQAIAGEAIASSVDRSDVAGAALGQQLCAARERLGWSRADVAARLKLPATLIARLESDDYEGLTQGVFLRGYLGSYARLVGVPDAHVVDVVATHTQAVPLIATGTISRSRYLFDRYSVSATYLVLTAIIVVPAVWLATHGGLEQNLARSTPLDSPTTSIAVPAQESAQASDAANTQPAAANPASTASTGEIASATPPVAATAIEQAPVVASMAPFATTPPPAPAAPEPVAATPAGSGAHVLALKLSQQSWVEILAADGRKLEYGILAGGSEHSYRSDGPVSVRLGNAQGAEVRSDGTVIDLAPFQRGNVAHVKLFGSSGVNGASRAE
jgi:cytoskeleton protein RodZ